MNVRTGPHGPPPAVVVIPSRWHLEVVMGQLQGLCSLAATSTASMAFALNTSTVFSFCAVQTGTLLHWCIPARGQVTQQIQHACNQHMTVFVFYPSEGCLSNVENMLSYWLGRECVQQMGDSRYLTISQCLVQGTLRSATSSSTEDEPSSSSSDEEEVMNASFQQESDRHRERAPSPPPAGLTKRLCLTRPCEKASIGQPLCIVCRENVASVVFLDCGHLSACENCICANWKKGTGKLCCYVCRAPSVLGPASVYISEHVVPRL